MNARLLTAGLALGFYWVGFIAASAVTLYHWTEGAQWLGAALAFFCAMAIPAGYAVGEWARIWVRQGTTSREPFGATPPPLPSPQLFGGNECEQGSRSKNGVCQQERLPDPRDDGWSGQPERIDWEKWEPKGFSTPISRNTGATDSAYLRRNDPERSNE